MNPKEMETLHVFKTNINCSGCVAAITPVLSGMEGITHWEVDTTVKEKILTVVSEKISEEEIVNAVQKAGYKIETIHTNS